MRIGTLIACVIATLVAAGCGKDSPAAPTPTCSFTVGDGPADLVASTGSEFTVSIATTAGCSWTASAASPFITPVGAMTGTGNGSVRFAVQANAGLARQGTVQVATRTIALNQAGSTPQICTFTVSPTDSTVDAAAADLTFSVAVTSGTSCAWSAASSDAFITVKSGTSGVGDGTVVLTVAANNGAARTGSATIAGRAVTIAQNAPAPPPAGCAFTLNQSVINAASTPSSPQVTITMTQGSGCAWTAQTAASWITFTNGSGTGSGAFTINIAANTGTARSATVTAGGQSITVNQAAAASTGMAMVLSFQSDTGDFIGQGQSENRVLTGTQFTMSNPNPGGDYLQFSIPPGAGTYWNLWLRTRNGERLTAGLYEQAQRASFRMPGTPGLDFFGTGRGCNRATGRFLVAEAVWSGNTLMRLHVRFDQHCEGSSAALRGQLWFDAQGSTTPPVLPQFPAAPPTPATFFSYTSDAGDFVGAGQSQTLTLSGMKAQAWQSDTGPVVNISFQSATGLGTNWNFGFQAPSGAHLTPGTYNNATRYPFQASGVPGLSVTGNSHGCNTLTGSFVVLEAVYGAQGEVLRFRATFEQHCEGAVPALRGEIYIVADPWR